MDIYKSEILADLNMWAEDNPDTARKLLAGTEDDRREYFADSYNSDGITGNATGSYYCNAYKAKQQLSKTGILFDDDFIDWLDAIDLDLGEQIKRGAEIVDVLARCWALEQLEDCEIVAAIKR